MTARGVRRVVMVVCVAGIAGMIAGSVADSNAIALTFGLITAAAELCLVVATAVAGGSVKAGPGSGDEVEQLAEQLVAGGADEELVRSLIRESRRGRPPD